MEKALVNPVMAEVALLRNTLFLIKEYDVLRACGQAKLAAGTFRPCP